MRSSWRRVLVHVSESANVLVNLAKEEHFVRKLPASSDTLMLLLYRNDPAVSATGNNHTAGATAVGRRHGVPRPRQLELCAGDAAAGVFARRQRSTARARRAPVRRSAARAQRPARPPVARSQSGRLGVSAHWRLGTASRHAVVARRPGGDDALSVTDALRRAAPPAGQGHVQRAGDGGQFGGCCRDDAMAVAGLCHGVGARRSRCRGRARRRDAHRDDIGCAVGRHFCVARGGRAIGGGVGARRDAAIPGAFGRGIGGHCARGAVSGLSWQRRDGGCPAVGGSGGVGPTICRVDDAPVVAAAPSPAIGWSGIGKYHASDDARSTGSCVSPGIGGRGRAAGPTHSLDRVGGAAAFAVLGCRSDVPAGLLLLFAARAFITVAA
eukprot:ctg_1860.g519